MLNILIGVKLEKLSTKIPDVLESCFSDVPSIKSWGFLAQPPSPPKDLQADAIVDVKLEGRSVRLLIETNPSGQPKQARQSINFLLRLTSQQPQSYPVFIAPYIAPAAANLCKECGVGYADLAGNCRFAFDGVYILREGKPNPFVSKRALKSLYQPAAARVLRALLANPKKAWKVIELQDEAAVSIGTVSNVRRVLLDREWIEKESDGIYLKNPGALLEDWSKHYSFRKNALHDFHSLSNTQEVEEAIASACARYALTSFSAASRLAPFVRMNRLFAYVENDIEDIATKLKLKRVSSGANVTLLEPYDDGIFYGSQEIDGVCVVSPIQAYLDLISFRGRGEEAAKHLLRSVIQKQW